MLNSVAYIGYGFVGRACHKAFEHNADAIIIDPKYSSTTISDLELLKPTLLFISINAPTLTDRSVDASVIYDIFQQLVDIKYNGLVVLKSTLPPDTVNDLHIKFGRSNQSDKTALLRYIYSPEFLREDKWETDAIKPPQIIMAGDFFDCQELKDIYTYHSHIRYVNFHVCDYKEASLAKYAINAFLASKVVFMNQLYKLYEDVYNGSQIPPESWEFFTQMLTTDIRIGSSHVTVPGKDGKYGYGGSCFPKDVSAIIGYDKNERLGILREVELANTKIRLTGDIKST